jgi:8-oxo-dGTP pyrophosphatase MutT (NUDIX family)
VLVPIVDRAQGATILLTERTAHLKNHAGQVAFPGGRADPTDASAIATALREAEEEIGLAADRVEVIGRLPDYFTGTGYQVTPIVAIVSPPFELRLQHDEVASVFEAPLAFLMNPRHHERRRVRWNNGERIFYSMPFRPVGDTREYFIWGATAAMLLNLYRFLSS